MVLKTIKNNKAFSIMGVLVASAIGLIVVAGLTKMFVHMSSQIKTLEQKARQTNLIGLIGNYMRNPDHCKATLDQVPTTDIKAGNDTTITEIKTSGGGKVIDIVAERDQLQTKYGMGGYVALELQCPPISCSSCGSFPCTQGWILSLISQTYVNNVPSFNRIMEIPFSVVHTSATNFTCN